MIPIFKMLVINYAKNINYKLDQKFTYFPRYSDMQSRKVIGIKYILLLILVDDVSLYITQ